MSRSFTVLSLNYVTFYVEALAQALEFYTYVFGPPDQVEAPLAITGWKMGDTWLTLFPSRAGTVPGRNPCNAEFAFQVAAYDEVDILYQRLVEAGAKTVHAPEDTRMYENMRYACVDDPFGIRLDIYFPLPA